MGHAKPEQPSEKLGGGTFGTPPMGPITYESSAKGSLHRHSEAKLPPKQLGLRVVRGSALYSPKL